MSTSKTMYQGAKRIMIEKKDLIMRSDVFELIAQLEKKFEMSDSNHSKCTINLKATKIRHEANKVTFIDIKVDGGHFEEREILFFNTADDNFDACYWCDEVHARMILTVIYNWIVGVQ